MEQGWVKFYREWLDNPIIMKDKDYLAVWTYLILNATHKERKEIIGSSQLTLNTGQVLISKRQMAEKLKINREKVNRIISLLESVSLIVSQANKHKTLVTIKPFLSFQSENVSQACHSCVTEQDRENEKEKSSKREKVKEKEINKNEIREEVCVYKNKGDTHGDLLSLGKYENVFVSSEWLSDFKSKYWYYDKIIDKLSIYKRAKGISNIDDMPYLELFAFEDKDKYIKQESTFDADEFFEAALARSYADDDE